MRQLQGFSSPRRSIRRTGLRAISHLGVGLLLLGACRDQGAASRQASIDSAMARDLTMASAQTPSIAPGATLSDTAVTSANTPKAPPAEAPAPVRRAPQGPARTQTRVSAAPQTTTPPVAAPDPAPVTTAPVPAPTSAPTTDATVAAAAGTGTAPKGRSLGAGSKLAGPTTVAICSLANRPGDRFVVSLAQPLHADGITIPVGTPVLVELAGTEGNFSFRLRGIQLNGNYLPAEGIVDVTEAQTDERRVSKGGDQGKVVGGAIAGAILGRVLGGGAKGAVIGAATGAAAGTVAAKRNSVAERCLAAGATLTATLTAPLTIPGSP